MSTHMCQIYRLRSQVLVLPWLLGVYVQGMYVLFHRSQWDNLLHHVPYSSLNRYQGLLCSIFCFSHRVHTLIFAITDDLYIWRWESSGKNVVMLQETHFRAGGTLKFASKFFPTSFLASDSTGKAGVAILIKKSCPIRVQKVHADPHGRYFILECGYMTSSFTLVNLYAPNVGQVDFLNKVFDSLQYRSQPFMIVGGDFNLIMFPSRGRQAIIRDVPSQRVISQVNSFRKYIRSHQLFDSWRIKHPMAKQYTFFSMAHKIFSLLYHFLVSAPLISCIVDFNILPITWSDHAPIVLDIVLSQTPTRTCHWRLNDHILQSEISRTKLATDLKEFFQFNLGSVADFSTPWEAHKAVF